MLIDTSIDIQGFRAKCAAALNWSLFFDLSKEVRVWPIEKQWSLLWSVLLNFTDDQSDQIAGFLLIDIDPRPQQTLQELLAIVTRSRWNLSNHEVPFYLVASFGKYQVLDAINAELNSEKLLADERVSLEGVRYWASFPVAYGAERLHYFEWQEVIERNND